VYGAYDLKIYATTTNVVLRDIYGPQITYMMICGIDEAGRGSVMGPLVVAAVLADEDNELKIMGVRDSKRLSPAVRERMYGEITLKYDYGTVILSAEEIDSQRRTISLNDIELRMFADAVPHRKISSVYADCPAVNTQAFASSLSSLLNGADVTAEHGADDRYPIVSAASVIAKVTRDRMISEISKEFGTDIGSGYPSDPVTRNFIAKWIKDNGNPPPHTRCSWETVGKMMALHLNRKITDWC
jgi:ribonuclease HII